jgi:signal transduction histidine kinase
MKESSREVVVEVTRSLQPYFHEITADWRRAMFAEFNFDGRAMAALERLTIGTGFSIFSQTDFAAFYDSLQYFGERLAKLKVSAREVARALEIYQQLIDPYLQRIFPPVKLAEAVAAMETLSWASFIAVSGAYFDAQKTESEALLSVLDAELSAKNLASLLERVLEISSQMFAATLGVVLLKDAEQPVLRVAAQVGFDDDLNDPTLEIAMGQGFSGTIAATGEPGILPDLESSHGVLNSRIQGRAKSLWGVPLKAKDQVIGVLLIGFSRARDWLPTERDLLKAIADRSALAIDRAGMTDALREREARIAELSAHLLKAQEEERKRISRELHDETGQALMVIRLYLGMLESSVGTRSARAKIHETLEVVDRSIEGIRRIIGRLSPLLLQELGLIAAVRKEAKDLAKSTGVKARVHVPSDFGRLPAPMETAIYRVVQEALHNVAKHANAQTVMIELAREGDNVRLLIEDDGVGISPKPNPARQTFGVSGMRERIATIGGMIKIVSSRGQGTRIEVNVPVSGEVKATQGVTATEPDASRPQGMISPAKGTEQYEFRCSDAEN